MMIGVSAGTDARHDLADEIIATAVDALDRIAEFRRERFVVHRMLRVDEPPHHVLDAVGGFDDADEQVPLLRVEPLQDDLRAIVERAEQIVHERLLVEPIFVERPGGLGPAERAIRSEPLIEIGRKGEAATDIGGGGCRASSSPGKYKAAAPAGVDQISCAMPCTRTSRLMRKSRLIHLLHSCSAGEWSCRRYRRSRLARAVPMDGHRQADVFARFELGNAHLVRRRSARALARSARSCCRTIGFGGPTSSVCATSPSNTSRFKMPPNSVLPSS